MKKLVRITTIPMALRVLLKGQMKYMKDHGFDVLMVSADGPDRKDLMNDEGCPHTIVPMTRKMTPLRDLMCLVQMIRLIRKHKPQIVHTHTPKAGLIGMLSAWICGTQVRIHTVAGLPMMIHRGFQFRLLKMIEKITYGCATQVWPNSQSLLDYISQEKLVKKTKLRMILNGSTNGVDLEIFSAERLKCDIIRQIRDKLNYSENDTYLLFAGRVVNDKGISELVRTFLFLAKDQSNLKLIILGPYESGLDPLPGDVLAEIQNNSNIIHIDWTNQIQYYMHISDFFVFPSHREGFPNVLLQAGAMKLPIICSKIPGNVDIVRNKETGLLFNVKNEAEMIECLQFALQNRNRMQDLSETLYHDIQNKYDKRMVQKEILLCYEKLLKN